MRDIIDLFKGIKPHHLAFGAVAYRKRKTMTWPMVAEKLSLSVYATMYAAKAYAKSANKQWPVKTSIPRPQKPEKAQRVTAAERDAILLREWQERQAQIG
jgi:hypothetical protein